MYQPSTILWLMADGFGLQTMVRRCHVAAVFFWLLNVAKMTEFNPLVEAESCTVDWISDSLTESVIITARCRPNVSVFWEVLSSFWCCLRRQIRPYSRRPVSRSRSRKSQPQNSWAEAEPDFLLSRSRKMSEPSRASHIICGFQFFFSYLAISL